MVEKYLLIKLAENLRKDDKVMWKGNKHDDETSALGT